MTSFPSASAPSSAAPGAGSAPSAAAAPRRSGLPALLVCLASLLLYLPTLRYELVYDDWFLIDPSQNDAMKGIQDDFSVALQLFGKEYWAGVSPATDIDALKVPAQALYRPLTLFVWATVSHLYGYKNAVDALPYHLINLLLNTWVVYLLFRVVIRLFDSVRLAVVTSLLFAVHPLHSEAVAYVAGLSDLLATAAVLLGLLLWHSATRTPGRLRVGPYVGMLLVLFLGLLAKELAVLLLAIVALTDLTLALRGRAQAAGTRLAVYMGLAVTFGAHLLMRYQVLGFLKPKTDLIQALDNVLINVPTDVRVANAFKLIAKYLWLLLWPENLSVDYSKAAIPVSPGFESAEPLSGLILCGAMLLFGLVKLRRSPAIAWGLLLFLGCTTFFSNMFVPFGTVFAERLMYLPSAGICLALAVLLDRLLQPAKGSASLHPLGLLLTVLLVGGFATRTWNRNLDFESSTKLFEAAARVVPDSARVHFQLGTLNHNQGLGAEAVEELNRALECDNNFLQAAIQLGDVYGADGNWDMALQTFTNVLGGISGLGGSAQQRTAVEAMVLTRRAEAHRQKGDLALATADLQRAASLGVAGSGADVRLVRLLQGQEKWAESIPVIRNALLIEPDNVELTMALCRAAAFTGDKATFDQSLAQLGNSPSAEGRALALAMEGETLYERGYRDHDEKLQSQAMDKFDQAIDLDPQLATPYFYRGRYISERVGGRAYLNDAIIEYDRALQRAPQHPGALMFKALAQVQLNLNAEALQTLAVLEKINPGIGVWALQSQAYFQLGDLQNMEKVHAKLRAEDKQPLEMILNRSISYDQVGDVEQALKILDQAFASPEYAAVPRVWRTAGLLQLRLGQYAEALASFEQQGTLLAADPEGTRDPYLPANRARALMGLGKDVEAAGQLEALEATIAELPKKSELAPQLRANLLHYRAELFLRPGGALFDASQAEALCAEGRELTSSESPPFFDHSIEALLRLGRTADALARAQEAQKHFFKLTRYPLLVEALQLALDGDTAGAVKRLQEAPLDPADQEDIPARIAAALKG